MLKVVKCADVNGNGIFNIADTTLILRGYFGIDPLNPATMDVNLNGVVNVADATLGKRVFFYALPGGCCAACRRRSVGRRRGAPSAPVRPVLRDWRRKSGPYRET